MKNKFLLAILALSFGLFSCERISVSKVRTILQQKNKPTRYLMELLFWVKKLTTLTPSTT